MKRHVFFCILLVITTFISCGGVYIDNNSSSNTIISINNTKDTLNNKKLYTNADTTSSYFIDDYFKDPIIKSYEQESDTIYITDNCVIFLWPDSTDIIEMKTKYADSYNDILDDMIEYSSDLSMKLDSNIIKNIFCDKSIIVLYNNKKDIIINRRKLDNNVLLYKYDCQPVFFNLEDIDIQTCVNFFKKENVDSLKNL